MERFVAARSVPLKADISRALNALSKDIGRRVWKQLQIERAKARKVKTEKLAKGDTPDPIAAFAQEYHCTIEYGQHEPISRLLDVVTAIRQDLDGLCAASPIASDALHGYFLNAIVLYTGDEIGSGCFVGGMADYEADQCRLYIAAGRLLDYHDHTLHVGDGANNVCKDFRSILAHEIGHLVMPKFEEQIREKFCIIYDSKLPQYWADTVSRYAATDDCELFAESFAAWTHPDYKPGMLPSILEEVMLGTDMMKLDWPKLAKATSYEDQNSDNSAEYNDNNDQGDVTITTADGFEFTSDMIERIIDVVKDADWIVVSGVISPVLMQAFKDAGYSELVAAGAGSDAKMVRVAASHAEKYAAEHGADLVSGLTDTTRNKLKNTVLDAIKEGWGNEELQEEIENNFAFGPVRADLIARNEIALAYGRGRKESAREAGAVGKRWLLSSDHDPKEDCYCSDAADAGTIAFDESFVDGDDDYDYAPGHVNCCCDVEAVYPGDDDLDDSDDDDSSSKMLKYSRAFDAALNERLALEKYSEDQARDDHGRFTAEGSESSSRTDSKSVSDGRSVSGSALGMAAPSRADFGNGEKPLEGLPLTASIPGTGTVEVGPYGPAREAARQYMAAAGLPYNPPTQYVKVDSANATKIAAAYDEMKDDPNAPDVKASYDAMIKETLAQYQAIKATGLKIEPIDYAKTGDPYAASPRLAAQDVIENNHLWFFPTASGFGSDEKFDASKNPLLGDSGERIGDHVMLNNDVFRVVHDYFGHIKEGNGFRADGEDNAWRSHSAMYSDLAKGAMTSETRGQNSWVNYGPYAESNRTASGATTHYADQKVGLMPKWTWDGSLGKLQKYSEDEPRDNHGKWTAGGDSNFSHDGKKWTGGTAKENARLNALKVPPAWKNVRLNPDPNGDKQAMGVDAKGRTQAIYSAAYRAGQDAAKFERLKEFNKVVPQAVDKLRNDMNNKSLDAATRDSAAATYLMSQTGIRIGSTKETGADKKAYGASTLEARHVKVEGDWISLNFIGKKGVAQKIKFEDADLAQYLGGKNTDRKDKVFADTTDAHIRDYFHSTIGDQFTPKDFRTWTGTATALRAIAGMKAPTTLTAFNKSRREVAKVVSEKLGNTPVIALKSYIDPTVFKSWDKSWS